MSLSKPKTIFGIHQITFYNVDTFEYFGTVRVLAGGTITLAGEIISLTGGSSKYIWDAQDGNITAELSFKPKEIPDFLFEILFGIAPTVVLNDPGNVTALTNKFGTSLQDATTGIASIELTSAATADLKFSNYLVKVISPTTVDVFASTNIDFFRGADKRYVDDSLKINDTPLTITMGGTTVVPDFGIEFIGGSGTIAMTADDTAEFDVNPPSKEQMTVRIGEIESCIPEFGAVVFAQKQSNGTMWSFDCFRVKATGFPFGLEEKAYNEAEITAMIMYDDQQNGVMNIRRLLPNTPC